jgi:hypothetical protein
VFHSFHWFQSFVTVLTRSHHWTPILSHLNTFHALTLYYHKVHFISTLSYKLESIRLILLYLLHIMPTWFAFISRFVPDCRKCFAFRYRYTKLLSSLPPCCHLSYPLVTGQTTIKQSKYTTISFAFVAYIRGSLCMMSPSCNCTNFVVFIPAWLHIIEQRTGTSDEGHRPVAQTQDSSQSGNNFNIYIKHSFTLILHWTGMLYLFTVSLPLVLIPNIGFRKSM